MNTLGDGISRAAIPTDSCTPSTLLTLTIGADERITKIEIWRGNDYRWYRIRLTLNNYRLIDYGSTPANVVSTMFPLKVPANVEMTGFHINGDPNGCLLIDFDGIGRSAVCVPMLSLATISGYNQLLFS